MPLLEELGDLGDTAALVPVEGVRIESNNAVHRLNISATVKHLNDLIPGIIRQMHVLLLDLRSDLSDRVLV